MVTNVSKTTYLSNYNDDYRDSDLYHRILFNSGKALQARELTQSQTIIQKEILNIPVIIQEVVSGDIRAIRDQIISLNESEVMTQNEKRSTDFTGVSLSINTTVSHPTVVQFFKKLPKIL